MTLPTTKVAKRELENFLNRPIKRQIAGIPPEDFMEQGADLLEDDWARSFFTTICGFSRLGEIITKHEPESFAKTMAWLTHHYPQSQTEPQIRVAIEKIAQESLKSINLNITLKRMTAILSQAERAHICEGLLNLASPEKILSENHWADLHHILTKLMLSQEKATGLIENWRQKPL